MRIGLCAPAVFCAGAVAALLSAGAASAAPITITSLTQDFEPRVSLVNGSTSPGPSTTAPSVRVGISGANSNRTYTNSLFLLPLRALNPGETITSANFGFTHLPETSASSVAPLANADLYAIGFVNENPPLNGDAQSVAYFYNGPLDAGAGIGGTGVTRALIQDNILTPGDNAITSPTARQTSDLGDAALLAYIESLYANQATNGFIPGTSSLLLRLNYDTEEVFTAASTANRYTIVSADSTTADPKPTLTLNVVPEPGAASLGVGALVLLLGRRRRA